MAQKIPIVVKIMDQDSTVVSMEPTMNDVKWRQQLTLNPLLQLKILVRNVQMEVINLIAVKMEPTTSIVVSVEEVDLTAVVTVLTKKIVAKTEVLVNGVA
jgi:hypothetical protein